MKHRVGVIDVIPYFRTPLDPRDQKYRYITLWALYFNSARTIYGQADTTRRLIEKQDNRSGVNPIFDPLTKAYKL
jgi:hypothetical protein